MLIAGWHVASRQQPFKPTASTGPSSNTTNNHYDAEALDEIDLIKEGGS